MNIVISGHHMDVTQDMRDEIMKRFRAVFRIFPGVITHVRVLVEADSFLCRLEAIMELRTHTVITAEVRNKDFHVALRELEDKLCAQLRRLKERVEEKHKRVRPPRRRKAAASL
ncbi:MAG: ribosome-associated translation inhibitor RaiA [bacterium]|nr:ribosome-associated translation inhibitor RaiA [bacterium]